MTNTSVERQNNNYPELSLACEDMKLEDELYRPSAFWNEASSRLVDEICSIGVDRFRTLPKALGFFVPTYGSPGNSFSNEQIVNLLRLIRENHSGAMKPELALDQFLSGYDSAVSDYRVLLASDNQEKLPRLHTFSESSIGEPIEHFQFDGRNFSRSSMNYLLGLALLKKHLGDEPLNTTLEIGGGFGSLGEILSYAGIDNLRYIDVDIPPTSFVAQYYLSKVLSKENVATYAQTRDRAIINIDSLPKACVLCSWQIEKLQGKVDLFVNFISFQEMEPYIVKNYLSHVTRLGARWILLRNMREGKQIKKDGHSVGVETPITSNDYLDMLPGYKLIERNVFPFGYRTVDGYNSELLLLRKKQ